MGNAQQQLSSFVDDSPLRFLNEDTFLCILQYLRISDFVHLTALSRDFNELLGPNNFLWAQMCEELAAAHLDEERPDIGGEGTVWVFFYGHKNKVTVAQILLAAFKDDNLTINGIPLQPNDILNMRDKNLVNQFNFKEAVKKYYIQYPLLQALQVRLFYLLLDTKYTMVVEVRVYDGQFNDVWANLDLQKHNCARDYYYYVDCQCNAKKLEKLWSNMGPLVPEIGGRLVVYQNSDVEPVFQ